MSFLKRLFILGIICLAAASGCSTADESRIPPDFIFVMDVESAGGGVAQHVNIRINTKGEGRYERYDTGGVVKGDANDMVTYEADQIVETGEFRVREDELVQLWEALDENNFFELTGDYRMAIGHSYAFIMVQAYGQRHQVFNIGLEVPEIKAVVEATEVVLPEGVDVVYRAGFVP